MLLEPADAEISELEKEIRELFPVPGHIERVWLAEALLRTLEDVTWLQDHHGGPAGLQSLRAVLELWRQQVPAGQNDYEKRLLDGDHGVAGIMVGDGRAAQPAGLQVFRALLWLVLRSKRKSNQRWASRVFRLAEAVRAACSPGSSASSALEPVLEGLASARTISEAIDKISPLAFAQHRALKEFWTGWLRPALEILASEQPVRPSAPVQPNPPRPPPFRRRPRRVPADVEEEQKESIDDPQVRRLVRIRPFDGQLDHEPAEEFGESTLHVTLPGTGDGLPDNVARFYAQRAIWTGNGHLLTTHVDALLPDVFGAVIRSLVSRLGHASMEEMDVVGAVGCLLKALTSRTTAGLKAFSVGSLEQCGAIAEGALDPDAGLIWIPVFWKAHAEGGSADEADRTAKGPVGYFRPTPSQRARLAPTSDRLALPMPQPVRDVFRLHRTTLEVLARTEAELLDENMSRVLAEIRRELSVPVTVGGLRRALGPIVREFCGDPAMAQLICGESIGLTSAPLSYYAPKMKTAATVYRDVLAEHLGPSPLWRIPAQATRVGSELMVTLDTARTMAASSAGSSVGWSTALPRLLVLTAAHRKVADHLARMILATTGHRPSEALFEITLSDIDLDSGAALFRDKRHDIAHDPRLACVPNVVIEQIRAYVVHLSRLQRELPSLCGEITEVLLGDRPLLCDLTPSGEFVRPTLTQIVARSPDAWKNLPWNWSRTWIRTSAVEAGAPAFLIAAQLGHFDSVGYPYSNQSPTEPLDVVERTRPWLDKLAKRQEWSVIESDLDPGSEHPPRSPRALRDWRDEIARVDEEARNAHRRWERRLKTERHELRKMALAAVLDHPTLVESGLAAADADSSLVVSPERLELLEVDQIRDDLVVSAGDDAIAAAARVRALKQVLRRLATRAGVPIPPLPIPVAVRRPLDNPFFQGACLALSQVTALREHVQDRSHRRSPQRPFALQVARTAETLVLFGGVDDPETVRAVLDARVRAVPSARLANLLLVPLSDGGCVSLWDTAAITLAALASEFPDEPLPDNGELEASLSTLLPAWAMDQARGRIGLLELLCSTVAVSNRFEHSPAARFARDSKHGSIQARVEEQIAFIDQDPVGPPRPAPVAADPPEIISRDIAAELEDHGARTTSARQQYVSLLAIIPKRGKSLELPLTNKKILATSIQTQTTRDAVVAELEAWLVPAAGRIPLWPIVRMLGEWILAEARRNQARERRLADRTLETYLTRIGSALVRILGELEFTQWDERVIEDAYAYALSASKDATHKVASALLSFHSFCDARFDLPDADLGGVYAALGTRKRRVDAALILPVEREAALSRLKTRAWHAAGDEITTRRARLSEFVAICLARSGARVSEPLGLRVDDVGLRTSEQVWVIIRPNPMRGLKTHAGRRSTVLDTATPEEHRTIWSWHESVRRHAPPGRAGGAYLLAELEDSRAFGEHHSVTTLIRSELARATGRSSERLHRLRHLKAQEAIRAVALSAEDARALGLAPFAEDRALEPRDFAAISVPLGQAHWMTTIQWYLHLPCLLQSRAASRLSKRYFGRQVVAGALGYTPAFLDNLMREGERLDPKVAWFNRFRPARIPPLAPGVPAEPVSSTWRWTARRVAKLMAEAGRCKDLESAVRLTGAPLGVMPGVIQCAARWERKLGRRLLPEFAAGSKRAAPGKALRRLEADTLVEALWDRFDGSDPRTREEILRIVNVVFGELLPDSGDTLVLPEAEAQALKDLLESLGVAAEAIVVEVDDYRMARVSVQRSVPPGKGGEPPLYGLRRVLAIVGIAGMLQDSGNGSVNSSSPCASAKST